MKEIVTINPVQVRYEGVSTEDLRSMLHYLSEPGFELIEEIYKKKIQEQKDFVWVESINDTKSMIKVAERKGLGVGIEWVMDIKQQIEMELERRAEEVEKELKEKREKDLQKNK